MSRAPDFDISINTLFQRVIEEYSKSGSIGDDDAIELKRLALELASLITNELNLELLPLIYRKLEKERNHSDLKEILNRTISS